MRSTERDVPPRLADGDRVWWDVVDLGGVRWWRRCDPRSDGESEAEPNVGCVAGYTCGTFDVSGDGASALAPKVACTGESTEIALASGIVAFLDLAAGLHRHEGGFRGASSVCCTFVRGVLHWYMIDTYSARG